MNGLMQLALNGNGAALQMIKLQADQGQEQAKMFMAQQGMNIQREGMQQESKDRQEEIKARREMARGANASTENTARVDSETRLGVAKIEQGGREAELKYQREQAERTNNLNKIMSGDKDVAREGLKAEGLKEGDELYLDDAKYEENIKLGDSAFLAKHRDALSNLSPDMPEDEARQKLLEQGITEPLAKKLHANAWSWLDHGKGAWIDVESDPINWWYGDPINDYKTMKSVIEKAYPSLAKGGKNLLRGKHKSSDTEAVQKMLRETKDARAKENFGLSTSDPAFRFRDEVFSRAQ